MSIESDKYLSALVLVGKIVGLTLRTLQEHVRPGITTGELDTIGAEFMSGYGVRSAPMLVYKFPGATCISVNDEAAHGVPGGRVIREGDLVKIDVTGELDGYFADAALT